jgi:hypothetical protein
MTPESKDELDAAIKAVVDRIAEGHGKELVKAGFRSLLRELHTKEPSEVG